VDAGADAALAELVREGVGRPSRPAAPGGRAAASSAILVAAAARGCGLAPLRASPTRSSSRGTDRVVPRRLVHAWHGCHQQEGQWTRQRRRTGRSGGGIASLYPDVAKTECRTQCRTGAPRSWRGLRRVHRLPGNAGGIACDEPAARARRNDDFTPRDSFRPFRWRRSASASASSSSEARRVGSRSRSQRAGTSDA
jgi:hypothetical protein